MQIDYPSDIDEFNKILGTSEGKGNLLKDLGIILNNEIKVFENPSLITSTKKAIKTKKLTTISNEESMPSRKHNTKKVKAAEELQPTQGNLFAGLFD
jgi:hypothetical protein